MEVRHPTPRPQGRVMTSGLVVYLVAALVATAAWIWLDDLN